MGDGKEESFPLSHDALDFLVGILQVFPIDTLLLGVLVDVPEQDDGSNDGDDGKEGNLPYQLLACFHRLVDGMLHGSALSLVRLIQLLGRTQGKLRIDKLQILHLLVHGFAMMSRDFLLFFLNIFQNVGHILCHIDRRGDRIHHRQIRISLYADGFSMFFFESVGKASEESSSGFQHFYRSVFSLVSLRGFLFYHNGVFSLAETVHLGAQIAFA